MPVEQNISLGTENFPMKIWISSRFKVKEGKC
jgi:hypothetical protein